MPLKLFKMLLLFKSLKPEGTLEILEFNPLMLHLGKSNEVQRNKQLVSPGYTVTGKTWTQVQAS